VRGFEFLEEVLNLPRPASANIVKTLPNAFSRVSLRGNIE
jgi:hypothetical protein